MPALQPNIQSRLRPFKPSQFGRYTLLMPLASGGMGEIFLARLEGAQGFEKLCVIKKILPHLTQEEDFVSRFVNEAKTLVQLSHGAIAQVLDMGLHDGEPYLALEFVDGKDLRKIAARARERNLPLPLTFVLYTMGRVLDALAYAHRKRDEAEKEIGLVHRDVSPQNILISYEGEVKVIDFGLAKSTLNVARTNPSIVLGKFLYMSPEQARHGTVDRRTDLYSVGLCLYELVSGKNPFDDVPPGELMARVANPNIAPIQQVEPLCPSPVAQTVMKALAVDPSQRFQTAEEFRGKLLSVLLDIDASAGPESCSKFMREAFSVEYGSERKLLATLREQRVTAAPAPVSPVKLAEPEALGMPAKKEQPTAVRNLTEIARKSMEAPFGDEPTPMPTDPRKLRSTDLIPAAAPGGPGPTQLSFAPTPRLKEHDLRAPRTDRETLPSIVVASEPLLGPPRPTPIVTLPEALAVSMPNPDLIVRAATPWPTNETTLPAGGFEVPLATPEPEPELPAVMTSEPSEVFEPSPRSTAPAPPPEPRRAAPAAVVPRPVTAPLPQALKNKSPPPERPETTGRTTVRSGFLWVVVPLLAVLSVAGYVIYGLWEENVEKKLEEIQLNNSTLGKSNNVDQRRREVEPLAPSEPQEAETSDAAAPAGGQATEGEPTGTAPEVVAPAPPSEDVEPLPARPPGHVPPPAPPPRKRPHSR